MSVFGSVYASESLAQTVKIRKDFVWWRSAHDEVSVFVEYLASCNSLAAIYEAGEFFAKFECLSYKKDHMDLNIE